MALKAAITFQTTHLICKCQVDQNGAIVVICVYNNKANDQRNEQMNEHRKEGMDEGMNECRFLFS